ncbi:unnamed protein product, partial [marine sediment metagenome]
MSGLFGATLISKFSGEAPIMSFQTDKNGTLLLPVTLGSGTLKWLVDGVEYITNSLSVPLIGNTV